MNLLQLVNEVERESGTVGQSQMLPTVAGATGRQKKIVEWTVQAWEDIQRERMDWTFRRRQFSHALTIGQSVYAASDLGLADAAGFVRDRSGASPFTIYDDAIGRADETRLRRISPDEWFDRYDIGTVDNARPAEVAIDHDGKLRFGAPPDKAYVARGWYRRALQVLDTDTDEPFIDEEFHKAIVWRALMLLARHDEAGNALQAALDEYRPIFGTMLRELTPQVELT